LVTLDIERLRINLSKKKSSISDKCISTQTQKHVLALLKRILRWASEMEYIDPPSHLKFRMPTVDNKKTEFMSEEQLQLYLQALDQEDDQDKAAFFKILLLTGIRRTALLNIRWADVDLKNGFVTLRGATAKNDKTQTLPLSPGAIAIFGKITPADHSEYIWPGQDGGSRKDFRRIGRRLRDKAGLPKTFRPCHGLRHHYASALACSGQVDLYKLQKLLTHGSAAMTQRYAHLTDDALRRAASVADGILDQMPSDHRIAADGDVIKFPAEKKTAQENQTTTFKN
jgi:integrase